MERVSFVGVIEWYLGWIHTFVTESDTFVPVQSFFFIYTICVHQHTIHNIKYTIASSQHSASCQPCCASAVQVYRSQLSLSNLYP